MTEEEVFTSSSEEDLIDGTWKKLKRDLQKQGFREGALKGNEKSFQFGFDLGYAEGYRLGEALGFHKANSGLLELLNTEKSDIIEKKQIFDDNQRQRACVLCHDETLKVEDVKDVLKEQKRSNDVILSNFSHLQV